MYKEKRDGSRRSYEFLGSVYNQQRSDERPDFAPTDAVYGICFVVEDKNTSLTLNCDISDPESHLSQLAGYVRSTATYYGWLTNGRQLMV